MESGKEKPLTLYPRPLADKVNSVTEMAVEPVFCNATLTDAVLPMATVPKETVVGVELSFEASTSTESAPPCCTRECRKDEVSGRVWDLALRAPNWAEAIGMAIATDPGNSCRSEIEWESCKFSRRASREAGAVCAVAAIEKASSSHTRAGQAK